MTKFIFYTDFHLTGKRPRSRTDEFPDVQLAKLEEIYKAAITEEVDFMVFGGDFFNTHNVRSYEMITRAIRIIKSVPVMTYSIVGQHDLIGYNQSTYKTSAIAFLEEHCDKYEALWEPMEVSGNTIIPCHWYDDIDELVKKYAKKNLQSGGKSILLAHKTIAHEALPFNTIQTKDIGGDFDLVLSGDWHGGFDQHIISDTIFYNPGSLSRMSISDSHRSPQYAVVEIEDDITITPVKLDCASSADEIFEQSFLEEIKQSATIDTEAFVNKLESLAVDTDVSDIFDLIQKVGSENKIKADVLDYLLAFRESA